MEVRKYVCKKRELQSLLLTYLEESNIDNVDFQKLINFIDSQNYEKDKEEFILFLRLLLNISNNHHRDEAFNGKIKDLIIFLEDIIKQTLSNSEIYEIFKSNKFILLFLIENQFITIDEFIINDLTKSDTNKGQYCHFFLPEIGEFLSLNDKAQIENDLFQQNPNIFNVFQNVRQIGENDSYICELIRKNEIDKFVSYVNRVNLQLYSEIKPSIFETNSFLIDKKTTLIEYAAFFGSIQIFQYLRLNNVKLEPSLWLYAIHSQNPDMIHLLEEYNVKPPKNSYESCLLESIKCHHNNITNYIKNNLLDPELKESNRSKLIQNVFKCSFHCANYAYFPFDFSQSEVFFNLCFYEYSTLVNLFILSKKDEFESYVILIFFLFNLNSGNIFINFISK